MRRLIVVMFLLVALPAVAWAQAPSNEELYQMIKDLERKLDTAIGEANKAKAEAARAKEEAAKAKEELARIQEAPGAAVPAESLVRTPDTEPGFGASAEVVYLRPTRSNLGYVIADPARTGNVRGSVETVEPGYGWGWRFGLGYDFGSGTEIAAQFTSLRTHDSESIARGSSTDLWGIWLHPNSIIDDNDVTHARASYAFEYYVVDLGVGQELDIGKHFGLSIGAGLRYASMKQDFDIQYRQQVTPVLERHVHVYNDNDFEGWGGRIGLGFDWRVGWGFNVFASVAGSVLVGDVDVNINQHDWPAGAVIGMIRANLEETIHNRVIPVIETRAGIGYTYRLKNGWSIGAKAGYEWQNWFNMVTAHGFNDDVDNHIMYTDTTDLGLDGFFLEGFITF